MSVETQTRIDFSVTSSASDHIGADEVPDAVTGQRLVEEAPSSVVAVVGGVPSDESQVTCIATCIVGGGDMQAVFETFASSLAVSLEAGPVTLNSFEIT